MAEEDHKKQRLIELLDMKVFDPILSTSATDFTSQVQRDKFMDLRGTIENEKRRYHEAYHSAADVKNGYLHDVQTPDTEQQDIEADDLELPTLGGVRDELMRLCDELQV